MGSWYDDLVESGVVRYESVAPIPQCWLFDRVVSEGLRSFTIEAQERIQRWTEEHDHDIGKRAKRHIRMVDGRIVANNRH